MLVNDPPRRFVHMQRAAVSAYDKDAHWNTIDNLCLGRQHRPQCVHAAHDAYGPLDMWKEHLEPGCIFLAESFGLGWACDADADRRGAVLARQAHERPSKLMGHIKIVIEFALDEIFGREQFPVQQRAPNGELERESQTIVEASVVAVVLLCPLKGETLVQRGEMNFIGVQISDKHMTAGRFELTGDVVQNLRPKPGIERSIIYPANQG
jgi:hypothetical protein